MKRWTEDIIFGAVYLALAGGIAFIAGLIFGHCPSAPTALMWGVCASAGVSVLFAAGMSALTAIEIIRKQDSSVVGPPLL